MRKGRRVSTSATRGIEPRHGSVHLEPEQVRRHEQVAVGDETLQPTLRCLEERRGGRGEWAGFDGSHQCRCDRGGRSERENDTDQHETAGQRRLADPGTFLYP